MVTAWSPSCGRPQCGQIQGQTIRKVIGGGGVPKKKKKKKDSGKGGTPPPPPPLQWSAALGISL